MPSPEDALSFGQMVTDAAELRTVISGAVDDYYAWAVGRADGGPEGDGRYPLRVPGGEGAVLVPSPAALKLIAMDAATAAAAFGDVEAAIEYFEPILEGALAAKAAAEAIAVPFQNQFNDAFSLQAALTQAVAGGQTRVDKALLLASTGLLFDFPHAVFRIATVNKADVNDFSELAVTRASTAYALNNAGVYQLVAANLLRSLDRGSLIEGAATTLSTAPTTFTAWSPSGSGTVTKTTGITPALDAAGLYTGTRIDVATTAYNIHTPGRTYPAGSYALSYFFVLGTPRFTTVHIIQAGHSPPDTAFVIDKLAQGGPAIVKRVSGFTDFQKLTLLANGLCRLEVGMTLLGSVSHSVHFNASDADGANVNQSSATTLITLYQEQIEAVTPGQGASSPIFTASGSRAADVVTLNLPSGSLRDQITIAYEGGLAVFPRSSLANPAVLNLVTDAGGAWLNKYIASISLAPAQNDLLMAPTEGGAVPYMGAMDGTFFWDGAVFASEAEMVAAAGGSGSMNGLVLANYVAPDAENYLAGVNFASDQQRFTDTNNAAGAIEGGYLKMTAAGPNFSAVSRKIVGHGGRAMRFSADFKKGTNTGAVQLGMSSYNAAFGKLTRSVAVAGAADTRASVIGSLYHGRASWVGLFQFAGTGTSFLKNPSLVEIAPARRFPSGAFMAEITGVAPNPLPAATQVIAQGDAGSDQDFSRIELRSNGAIHQIHKVVDGDSGRSVDLTLASVAAGGAFHIIAGADGGAIRGAVDGVGAESDANLALGVSAFRLGVNEAGAEAFGGTITGYRVLAGLESLDWMRRRTKRIDSSRLWVEGDSYGAANTGISSHLPNLRKPDGTPAYDIVTTAVGGSTFAEQHARIMDPANLADFKERTLIWIDGDANGHTAGQTDAEFDMFQAVVAALGHRRILYVRSGRIGPNRVVGSTTLTTARSQSALDMDLLAKRIGAFLGQEHVYDMWPAVTATLRGTYGSAAYLADLSDQQYGYFQRTALSDGVHESSPVRAVVAKDMQPWIDRVRGL